MSILYVCAVCVETGNNEWSVSEDRNDLRVMPDGRWICDGCYDEVKWELLTDKDGTAAVSTYAGCHHDVEAPIDADNHGLLFLNSAIRYTDILDGSSQTFLIGEMMPYEYRQQDGGRFSSENQSLGWVSGTRSTLRNTGSSFENTRYRRRQGAEPLSQPGPLDVGGFSSAHPGGAQFALADGSCQFFSEDTDAKVRHQLGHRADGTLQESY